MMRLLKSVIFFALVPVSLLAEEAGKAKAVEVTRSVTASYLDEKGFSAGSASVKKGEVYELAKEELSSVVVKDGGKLIKLPKDAVNVTEVEEGQSDSPGGSIRIISAKFGYGGNRQYEVKEEIKKRLRDQKLDEPVEILVTDALLRAKASLVTMISRTVNGMTYTTRNPSKMLLTVTYEVNGVRRVKETLEGRTLVLP